MPSEDKYHEENPKSNGWLASATLPQTFSTPPGSYLASLRERAASRTPRTSQAARVQALAAKLGLDAEELAKRIPEDTLRRLKFPVIEQIEPETGLTQFKHDMGIVTEKRTPLLATDRAYDAIEKGSHGRGAGTSQPRDKGKFSK